MYGENDKASRIGIPRAKARAKMPDVPLGEYLGLKRRRQPENER
jgi:hypothetical protein